MASDNLVRDARRKIAVLIRPSGLPAFHDTAYICQRFRGVGNNALCGNWFFLAHVRQINYWVGYRVAHLLRCLPLVVTEAAITQNALKAYSVIGFNQSVGFQAGKRIDAVFIGSDISEIDSSLLEQLLHESTCRRF